MRNTTRMMGTLRRFWRGCAECQPLVTIALTNGTMGAAGDILAQCFFPDSPAKSSSSSRSIGTQGVLAVYDPLRTARFFAYGCMFGPVAFKWYSLLNRRFPFPKTSTATRLVSSRHNNSQKTPAASKKLAILKRVSVDQVLFAPVAIAAFFTVMGTMEGKDVASIRKSLCERYPKALAGNYMLWPWSQMINFGLVPLVYQVPFASAVSIVWNMYLSWVNSRHQNPQSLR